MAMTFHNIADITNQTFPFVTIPKHGLYVAKSMPFTGAVCTYLLPMVRFDQREQWETYAAGNNTSLPSWVNEALHMQDHWTGFYGPMPQNYSYTSYDTGMYDSILLKSCWRLPVHRLFEV
jgi:hypothetical protein